MDNFNFDLFKKICETRAISGEEEAMVSLLRDLYLKNNVEIVYDNLGSMVAFKKSKKENAKKVLVLAHSDEIGLIVTNIEKNGIIRVSPVGGISTSKILGNRVYLKNNEGRLFYGVVDANTKYDKFSDLELDFGFDSKEEVLENNISIGNSIYFEGDTCKLNDNIIVSKAIDNRYGCFLTVELLENLKDTDLDVDLYVGVSVQEEVGCRGALTITHKIKPDFAIILDCAPADPKSNSAKLGGGVLLRVKDANMLAFKSLINYQKEVCEKLAVPYQYFISMGGTDAGSVHKSYDGVLTMTHCICAKNLHTASTIMDVNDYIGARQALIYIVKDLNEDKIEKFKEENR